MHAWEKMAIAALLLGLPVSPVIAAKIVPQATIINTGSTNTTGYRIVVSSSGRVQYTVTRVPGPDRAAMQAGQIKKPLAQKLFRDIAAAMPLSQLPVRRMMKSVSFGTSLYLEYLGQRSPDLSAPADPRGQALAADLQEIATALDLKNGPRRPVRPMPPNSPPLPAG